MLTERGGGGFAKVLSEGRGGDFSSKFQRMSPDFLEIISHTLSDEVELKVVWGSSWMIPLLHNQRGHVFFEKQKWCEFVDDNSLTEANVLTFEHERDNHLFVTIFNEHGAEIREPPQRSCCTSLGDSI